MLHNSEADCSMKKECFQFSTSEKEQSGVSSRKGMRSNGKQYLVTSFLHSAHPSTSVEVRCISSLYSQRRKALKSTVIFDKLTAEGGSQNHRISGIGSDL